MRSLVRLLPLALLAVLVVVFRDEVAGAVGRMLDLHPVVFAIVPLFWLWNHVAAYSWRGLLQATAPDQPPESAWRLSLLRLQSQAINMAVPALGLGGGAVRIGFTRRAGLAPAASAALLDDLAGGVGGLLFVAFGLALHRGTLLGVPTATVAAVCAAGGGVLWLGIVYGAPALGGRFGEGKPIGRALRVLSQNRSRLAPAFALGVGWHFVERLITAGEIYLAFLALGAGPGLPEAVFVQAVSVAVALLLFFIPGQPGAADASIAAACVSVGLDPQTGLTVALIRRVRQLAVIGAGLATLAFMGRRTAPAPLTGDS